jgi:hypothetical protein
MRDLVMYILLFFSFLNFCNTDSPTMHTTGHMTELGTQLHAAEGAVHHQARGGHSLGPADQSRYMPLFLKWLRAYISPLLSINTRDIQGEDKLGHAATSPQDRPGWWPAL